MDPDRSQTILITGSSGLIGSALAEGARAAGHRLRPFDLLASGVGQGDIRDLPAIQAAARDCDGIVHLAAVSRVIDGERDPDKCWHTNVEGTCNVVQAATTSPRRPWIIYGSSREVYGQPDALPTSEDAARRPVNIYGRSKIAAENLCNEAALNTVILRFSNVFGSTSDHTDRVVPAFARQAALGLPLRVDGSDHVFDFNHVSDTVAGILAVIGQLQTGRTLPPIHFVTGQPTTLGELAALAIEIAGTSPPVREAPPRSFDVSRFYGDPSRARELLGWKPRVPLRDGLRRLIQAFRDEHHASTKAGRCAS